ncbi:beta strand repeat-containing protein [Thermodesulfobacteriota bacterium]
MKIHLEKKFFWCSVTVFNALFILFSNPCYATNQVTLQWTASTASDIDGYKIYYKTESSGDINDLSTFNGIGITEGGSGDITVSGTTEVTLHNLAGDAVYYFAVTAFDNEDPINEGRPANQVATLVITFPEEVFYVNAEEDEPYTISGVGAASGEQVTIYINDVASGTTNAESDSTWAIPVDFVTQGIDETGVTLEAVWSGVTSPAIMGTYDRTAPTVAITYSKSDPYNFTDTVTITATFTDVNAISATPKITIDYADSGSDVSATNMTATANNKVWTYEMDVPNGNNGTATIMITGNDAAGNPVGAHSGDTFEIDNQFNITPNEGGVAVGETINLVAEGASGTVQWTVNTAAKGSVGSLTGDHSENGVFTGSAVGTTTITVTDGGPGGSGLSVTSGIFEVVNPVSVTPVNMVVSEGNTLQFNALGGKGTANNNYTWTIDTSSLGTIVDGLFTPAAGDGVRTFTATATDKIYTDISGQSATVTIVDPIAIVTSGITEFESGTIPYTYTGTGGSVPGTYVWSSSNVSAGSINLSTGEFTPATVTSGIQTTTITATDPTFSSLSSTVEVTVYGSISITSAPSSYDANNPSTFPLLKGAGTTYAITAAGGPPSEDITWSVKDSSGTAVTDGISTSGVVDADTLVTNGAGVYTVVASKTGATDAELKVLVPMRIAPLTGYHTDTGANQDFTVSGITGNLTWYVTDESGTVIETPTFGSFTDPFATGTTVSFDFIPGIEVLTTFRVLAESSDEELIDNGIETVITNSHIIIPVTNLAIQVNDEAGSGISGAVITAVHDQTITATADSTGAATIAGLSNTGISYEFSVAAAGYLPGIFTVSDLNEPVTITLEQIANPGIIAGTISPAGEGISVMAMNADGNYMSNSIGNPIEVFANSAMGGAYTLSFDQATFGTTPYTVVASRLGYVTNVDDNEGIAANVNAGVTNADIALTAVTKITITDDGGDPNLTFFVTANPAFDGTMTEIQLSEGTSAQATPYDGDSAELTLSGATYEYTLTTPAAGESASIYVQADTSTAGRDASSNYYASKAYTFVSGVTISATATQPIDPTDFTSGTTVASVNNNATAELPPGGVDTLNNVTLAVSEASTLATTTGSALIFEVRLTYTATGEEVPDELINKVYITISFDPSQVPVGSLESGSTAILQADDLAAMVAGTVSAVPRSQIISVNYVSGKVTFWVNHLSVFGVGTAPSSSGSTTSSGGCFIATAAYGSPFERHVTVLREFRDFYLMPTKIGSAFVEVYYKYSPAIAEFIGSHDSLKVAVRLGLAPVVGISYVALHTTAVEKIGIMLLLMVFLVVGWVYTRRVKGYLFTAKTQGTLREG